MRFFLIILVLAVTTLGLLFVGDLWLASQTAGSDATQQFVMVRPGDNFLTVTKKLESANVIRDARFFRWYANIHGLASKMKVGEYALSANQSNQEILSTLVSGKSVLHKLTVPEGSNRFQIADSVQLLGLGDRQKFLEATESQKSRDSVFETSGSVANRLPKSVEGYLYPDTYMVSRLMSEAEIVRLMIRRTKEVLGEMKAELEAGQQGAARGLTLFEILTLASVVEKETGAAKERPLIASVFYNRLHKNMRLQSDPTTIYGIWDRDGSFDGNIRRKDLTTDTPYNTYTVNRLPIGPVCNPGRGAIEAVLKPGESNYLYFVSRNDGTHVFTTNYKDHQRAVDQLQKNRAAREGKSWRDLPADQRAH